MLSRQVLVVEDDSACRGFFCRWLERNGFQVIPAASGSEAIARAVSCVPDIVLLDINLGVLNGITVCRRLREIPTTSNIPVILLTGLTVPEDLLECAQRELGCGRIWRKGGDPSKLIDRIHALLGGRHAQRPRHGPRIQSSGSQQDSVAREHLLRRGELTVDIFARKAWMAGRELPKIAPRRFQLLCTFIRHRGPIARLDLLKELWGIEHDLKAVHMTVARLRQDLKSFPSLRIDTTPKGYVLKISALPAPSRQ